MWWYMLQNGYIFWKVGIQCIYKHDEKMQKIFWYKFCPHFLTFSYNIISLFKKTPAGYLPPKGKSETPSKWNFNSKGTGDTMNCPQKAL